MKKAYEKNLVENIYKNIPVSYEKMLEFLQGDDFEQKHFALTFINTLKKDEDIEFFIQNLTGEDTKIRELASFRINDFILEKNFLMRYLENEPEILLHAIDDVNPQVCRNICALLDFSQNKSYFSKRIIEKINVLIEKTKSVKFKSHKVNKEIFHLYWNFFALEILITENFEQFPELLNILEQSINYKDYTIRERVAFLVKKLEKSGFSQVKIISEKLQNDENFYVKKALVI